MENRDFTALLLKRKQTITSITVIVLLIAMLITFIHPLEYKATTKILIMQNSALDAYSASKANQFLTSTLSQVVYSDSFFEYVIKSGYNIDQSIFSNDLNKRKKQWSNMVSAVPSSDTGMIVINTYQEDKFQVAQINRAIAYTLKTKHNYYHGLGDKVEVKIIDKTSVSDWPARPNIILNLIFSLSLGLLISFAFVYLFPKNEIKLINKRSKKKKNNEKPKKDYELPREVVEERVKEVEKKVQEVLKGKNYKKQNYQNIIQPKKHNTSNNYQNSNNSFNQSKNNINHNHNSNNNIKNNQKTAKGSMDNILKF